LQDEDEEARYSAVSRGGAGGAGGPSFDTRNDDTFGTTAKENGRAWSSAAGSVAAVTGR
jgi:hypothetical protein